AAASAARSSASVPPALRPDARILAISWAREVVRVQPSARTAASTILNLCALACSRRPSGSVMSLSLSSTARARRGHRSWIVTRGCGLAVVAVGLTVLLGWATGNEILKRILPSVVAMNPTTASGLLCIGLGLALPRSGPGRRRAATARRVLGGLVLAVG